MQLSLSGFLFEDDYSSQSLSFADFCALAQSAGYQGVELRDTQVSLKTPKEEREVLLGQARDNGLFVSCLTARGIPAQGPEREEVFLRVLELCRDMDCRLLKIGGDTAWLHDVAEKAKDYRVTLSTNNHGGTGLETVVGTRQYFTEINHPNFALLYDSLHLMAQGEDYLGAIPEFYPITRNILFHSIRPAKPGELPLVEKLGKSWAIALPDEPGVQDWSGIFRAFKALGYDGLVTVIENGWPREERETVARHCAEFIRKCWEAF
jgi:sugar phosphate isomerase/epimerase